MLTRKPFRIIERQRAAFGRNPQLRVKHLPRSIRSVHRERDCLSVFPHSQTARRRYNDYETKKIPDPTA